MTETSTTPDRTVLTGKILSQAAFTATIDAPIGKIDIADWLRTLPDREYQRCAPPDHTAAGYTATDDGRPLSINVEMVGTGLVVQHYAYETAGKGHCHMVSISDVLTPQRWTTVQVICCGRHVGRGCSAMAASRDHPDRQSGPPCRLMWSPGSAAGRPKPPQPHGCSHLQPDEIGHHLHLQAEKFSPGLDHVIELAG
jgi:hypothetical protein